METISYVTDYSVLLKQMRLKRRLNREQAGMILNLTYKYLEKLENGRGLITTEKFKEFQSKYKFKETELEDLRLGVKTERTLITPKKRPNRRFCHRQITRECKVLKEMRLLKNIDQYSASKLCGHGRNTIGFIENGRVHLTQEKIRNIVETYGLTMELFNQLLKRPQLRHEMIEECQEIIGSMDENKLMIIMPMLQSMKGK
ncbi:MAG: helix-turn-helix transcriptional regulator [Bacteriovoracaceae bacterium]